MALDNVPLDQLEENKPLADLKEGIEMTHAELNKAFERHNITLGKL